MLTLREALTRATDQLSAHPDLRPTALPDAAVLLMHTLGLERATLIAHPERTLDREQQAAYQRLLERRLRFEPIQYILGHAEFYGLRLCVTPAVLIPRPETELLVEAVLNRLPHDQPQRIVDIGTGSGAIAIALTHTFPQASVTALDLSPEALAIAGENASTHSLAGRIRLLQSDLLGTIAGEEPFDAIVSNPPYVPTEDASTLHPQVRDHEPSLALYAGVDGLEVHRRLIPQAFALLKPNGLLALEIGHGQRDAIAELLAGWNDVEFLDDLRQIPRVALARRPR
jgi:release factor glutamine methyltransferase